jgi:hypothetical protein
VELDGGPGRPDRIDQLSKVGQARHRGEARGRADLFSQEPEDYLELVLGTPPGGLDGLKRNGGLLGPFSHQPATGAGLHGDHGQAVGDNVVQVACDPDPLVPDSLPGSVGVGCPVSLPLLG